MQANGNDCKRSEETHTPRAQCKQKKAKRLIIEEGSEKDSDKHDDNDNAGKKIKRGPSPTKYTLRDRNKIKKRFSDFCLETPFYDDDADLLTAVFLSQEDMNKEELLEDDSEIIHFNDAKKQKRHDKAASLHKYIDKFTARKKSKEEREADIGFPK